MAKKTEFVRGRGTGNLLDDRDWITAIDALLQDKTAASQRLAKKLLLKTKHGRQIRMLRLLNEQRPRIKDMQKALKVSRRSIFRYLTGLEEYGVDLQIDEKYCYQVERVPESFRRLMASSKKRK